MQERSRMDIEEWRAAADRDELWMYVDQHWSENAPDGLTEQEMALHGAARIRARTGEIYEVRQAEPCGFELVRSR